MRGPCGGMRVACDGMCVACDGVPLACNCICVDTLASTHVNESDVQAGSAANIDETVKRTKNRFLTDSYQFEAIDIETAGTYS